MKTNLFCPCCSHELVVTHKDRYEDLGEHVSDPNGTPSMKDGYQCTYEYCEANNLDAVWIEDGDMFIRNKPEQIKWAVAHNIIEKCSRSGMQYALNSWNHYYQEGQAAIKARTKKITIGKWKIVFVPKEKGHKYPLEKQYQPQRFSYKLEYWKRTEDGNGYTSVVPDFRMVKYCLQKFNREYRSAIEGNKSAIQNCLNEIECYSSWGSRDDRRYAKITSFLLRTLHYAKTAVIRELAAKHEIKPGR